MRQFLPKQSTNTAAAAAAASVTAAAATAVTTAYRACFATSSGGSSSSYATTAESSTRQQLREQLQPNRFTEYVNDMKRTCPDVMRAYAACVLKAQRQDDVQLHRVCEDEFNDVKDCFRRVRRR